MKKLLGMLLALCMIFGLLPLAALAEDETVFAQFMLNDGTEAVYKTVEIAGDGAFTVPEEAPSREGWSFVGWAMSPDEDAWLYPGDEAEYINGDSTFYAIWEENAASPDESDIMPLSEGEEQGGGNESNENNEPAGDNEPTGNDEPTGDNEPAGDENNNESDTVTITFHSNNGKEQVAQKTVERDSWFPVDTTTADFGDVVFDAPEDKIFRGWSFVAEEGVDPIESEVLCDCDMDFYAVWSEPAKVSLSFSTNGYGSIAVNGQPVGDNEKVVVEVGQTVTIKAIPNEGYVFARCPRLKDEQGFYTIHYFKGWEGLDRDVDSMRTVSLGENFMANTNAVIVDRNTLVFTIPESNVPYYDDEFGYGYRFSDICFLPEDNICVRYHVNGDKDSEVFLKEYIQPGAAITLVDERYVNINGVDPSRMEYASIIGSHSKDNTVLVGWTTRSSSADVSDEDIYRVPYGTETSIDPPYYTFEEDTDLYPVYRESVDIQIHSSLFDSPESVVYMMEVVKGEPMTIRLRESDIGWGDYDYFYKYAYYTEPDGSGTCYYPGEIYQFYEDIELYQLNMADVSGVTLTLHTNEGTKSVKVAKGRPCVLGWFHDDGSSYPILYWGEGSPDSDIHYSPADFVTFEEDTDLYAVESEWITLLIHKNEPGCTYDRETSENAPKNCTLQQQMHSINRAFGNYISDINMARRGWSLTPDGEPLPDSTVFTEDTELYAVWGKAVLAVYDPNGGIGGGRFRVAVGNCLDDSVSVRREGYTLAGWSLTKDGDELYDFTKPIEGGMTLYAVWTQPGEDEPDDEPDDEADNTRTDESTGVTVEVPEEDKAKIEGLVFVAQPLPKDKETVVVTVLGKKMSGTVEKSFVLDIYFAKAETGEVATVEGVKRTITVPIPEGWDTKRTHVVYVDPESGRVENMNGIVSADGKTISFTTSHFSYYALVQVEPEPEPTPTVEPTPTAKPEPTPEPSATPESAPVAPNTGDEAMPILWLALLAAAGLALVLAISKRKHRAK